MRNIILGTAIILTAAFSTAVLLGDVALAADCADTSQTSFNWGSSCADTTTLVSMTLQVLAWLVGIAVVIGIAWGGMMYATSNGNSSKAQQGIGVIVNSIIGLLFFIFIFALTNYFVPGGIFGRSGPTPGPALARPAPSTGGSGSSGGGSTRPPEQPTTFKPGQVLIVGDSITAGAVYGNNHGYKAWWEYALDGKKGMFKFSAQGGSGYVTKGNQGSGTTFYERIGEISRLKPKAIIIAGGVNDRGASNAAEGIKRYYTKLNEILKAEDIPKKNVYIIVLRPTGTTAGIIDIVKSNASRIGVRYIEVGSYPASATRDGLHPTSVGAEMINKNFSKRSDFDERLKSAN